MAVDNLVIGRGKIYFDPFITNTQTKTGERDLGDAPAFSVSVSSETVKKYTSDTAVKRKARETVLSSEYSGTLTIGNLSPENQALIVFGSADKLTTVAAPTQSETFNGVKLNRTYQLGVTNARPDGVRKVTVTAVKVGAAVKTLGTDYTVDATRARVTILSGGTIADGANVIVEYDILASTRDRVISGSTPIEGALRFIADNADGDDTDVYLPWVKLIPNSEYALKGEQYAEVQFNVAVQKLGDFAEVYMAGQPV